MSAGEGKEMFCSNSKPFTGLRFNLVDAVTSNNPQSRNRFSSFHSIESLFALLLSIDGFFFFFQHEARRASAAFLNL